jgi:hypothetical protein
MDRSLSRNSKDTCFDHPVGDIRVVEQKHLLEVRYIRKHAKEN